jgi:hypothetical protein
MAMSKVQILIMLLLIALVVGVFGMLAYLLLSNQASSKPAAQATPAATLAAGTPALPPPTATRGPGVTATRWAGATAASADAIKKAAQSTVKAGGTATAQAEKKIDAALVRWPAVDMNVAGENGRLSITINRMGWLAPGQIWVKVTIVNLTQEKLAFDPARLVLVDAAESYHSPDAVSSTLPNALAAAELAPAGAASGQVAFKLSLKTVPAALIYDDGVSEPIKTDIFGWLMKQPVPTPTPKG